MLAFLILLSSCRVINNNNYKGVSNKDKGQFIQQFSLDDIDSVVDYKNEFFVSEIEAKDIIEVCKLKKYTWVYFWAPWCPTSYPEYFTKIKKIEDEKRGQLKCIIIAISYDLKFIKDIISQSEYNKPVYVLKNKIYGSNMTKSQAKLGREIDPFMFFKKDKYATHYLFADTTLIFADYKITQRIVDSLMISKH